MKILLKIIRGIITLFLIVVLFLVIFQKVTNNKLTIGNIYIFEVASDSMVPEYKVGDVIVVKKVPIESLKIGDDITYLGKNLNVRDIIVTHRIVNEREENGIKYFITKGIANQMEDPEISEANIYGKVVYHTIIFSFIGRLMTNMVIYYLLFVVIGISFAYEVISYFLAKTKNNDEGEEDEE